MTAKWDRLSGMQAADIVGCTRQTITNARQAGQFPTAHKVGRMWAYAPEEVERFREYFNSTEFDDENAKEEVEGNE